MSLAEENLLISNLHNILILFIKFRPKRAPKRSIMEK